MDRIFTGEGTWRGGDFELVMAFGRITVEEVRQTLAVLWSHPSLDGWYADSSVEPWDQVVRRPEDPGFDIHVPWYGVATLPNQLRVACRCCAFVWEDGSGSIDLGLPMGALEIAYPVGGYPFGEGPLEWRAEVSAWFASIGEAVFAVNPFRYALIEHEIGTGLMELHEVGERPPLRFADCLWPEDGRLVLYPQTT